MSDSIKKYEEMEDKTPVEPAEVEKEPTRKINITIEIGDDNFIEARLREKLGYLLGDSLIDYQVLPDTSELYEKDTTFRKLISAYKSAKRERNDYINKHIVLNNYKSALKGENPT